MTFRKVVSIILISLAVIILAAGVFLKVFLSDERLRATIEPMLEEALSRDVSIERFEFRLLRSFPDISVGIDSLVIHTPDRPDLASIDRIWVDVPLWPLLQSRVVVKQLEIQAPKILVEVYDDLSTNLIEFSSEGEGAAPAEESTVHEISLERIEIIEGEVAYVHADGTLLAVGALNGILSANLTDLLALSGSVNAGSIFYETGGIPYADGWPVSLDLDANVHLDSAWLAINSANLSLDELGLAIQGRVTDWDSDRIGVDLSLNALEASVPALWSLLPAAVTKDIEGLQGSGRVSVEATILGDIAEEELPALNARIVLEDGSVQYPGLPEPITGLSLFARVTNDELNVGRLTAKTATASLDASGIVRNFASPSLTADIDLDANLAAIDSYYPLDDSTELQGRLVADATIEGPLSNPAGLTGNGLVTFEDISYASPNLEQSVEHLQGYARLDQNTIRLENLSLTSGRSDFRFDGQLENYGAWLTTGSEQVPLLTGRLNSNLLDVTEQLSDDTTSVGPVELPDLRMNVDFSAGELVYSPFQLRNASTRITLENGVFGFEDARAGFFEGLLAGSGTFDLSNPMRPIFQGSLSLADVRASRFFSAFSSMDEIARIGAFLDGLFDSQATLSLAMDKDFKPALETLLAEGIFGAKQGLLKDMPLQKALATYTGVSSLNSLPIRSWSHHFDISGEALHVQDLSLEAGDFLIALNGSQSFDGNMDYGFSILLPESASSALAAAPIQGALQPISQLANTALVDPSTGRIALDLSAEGPFSNPSIRLNGDMMKNRLQARATMLADEARAAAQARLDSLENAARTRVEAELEEQKQALEERAQDAASGLLEGIVDSTEAPTSLDSLKEAGEEAIKDRLRGLLRKKKNND